MAKDLDFRVRRTAVVAPNPAKPAVVAAPTVVSKGSGSSVLLWTIIVVLLLAAAIAVWQFTTLTKDTASSPKTTVVAEKTTPITPPSSASSENSILSPQSSSPIVQIYDSGAGTTAVSDIVAKLKALGYKVDNLEKSQFNYDRTYIRYRAGMQSEAEKIQSAMPERLVSMKEVVSAGLFDILILYGAK